MNVRICSASLGGLYGLIWNAFSVVTASDKYYKIVAPSFTVDKITTILGGGPAGLSIIILTVAGGGIAPAWAIPGAGVAVNITYGGVPIKFSVPIREVSSDGKTITLAPNQAVASLLSEELSGESLDAIAGSVVNSVTLNIQAQKVMFNVPSGEAASISIAPVADANGANPPYSVSVAAGFEYEVTAPNSGKFDLADWWVKSDSATPTLTIRFL